MKSPNDWKVKLTKEDQVEELIRDLDLIYQQYLSGTKYEIEIYNKQADDFNNQLAFIDGIRQTYLMPLINQLYSLLSNVGNPSKKLSSTILLTDRTKKKPVQEEKVDKVYEKAIQRLRQETDNSQNLVLRTIQEVKDSRYKIEAGMKAKRRLSSMIAKRQEILQNDLKSLNVSLDVIRMYRDVIVIVKDSLERYILPELKGVRAFLIAENVKNNIMAKNDEAQPVPESIILLANTEYQKHYLFVKTVFGYYTLLLELFESPIVVAFASERELKQAEIQHFMNQRESIQKQLNMIRENLVFEKHETVKLDSFAC